MAAVKLLCVVIVTVWTTARCLDPDLPGQGGAAVDTEVCLSEDCVLAAARLLQSMNQSADPCTDFFKFACGSWHRANQAPLLQQKWSNTKIRREQIDYDLTDLLKQNSARTSNSSRTAFGKLKVFYDSCMDVEGMKRHGSKPVLNYLDDAVDGHFKFLYGGVTDGDFKVEDVDFERMLAKVLLLNGRTAIMKVSMTTNSTDRNYFTLLVEPAALFHKDRVARNSFRGYLVVEALKDEMVSSLRDVAMREEQVEDTFTFLDLGRDLASSVVNFLLDIDNIVWQTQPRSRTRYPAATLSQLNSATDGQIDWGKLFQHLGVPPTFIKPDMKLYVSSYTYFSELGKLMKKTPKRDVYNALVAILLKNSASLFYSHRIQELDGEVMEKVRPDFCLDYAKKIFPETVAALYVRNLDNPHLVRRKLEIMTENIRQAFVDNLVRLEWVSGDTRQAAYEKAREMGKQISFSDKLFDDNILEDTNSVRAVTDGDMFSTMVGVLRGRGRQFFGDVGQQEDDDSWDVTVHKAFSVGAVHALRENVIYVYHGILSEAHYSPGLPNYMNYGAVGATIGHEMTHGFDVSGGFFDSDGNRRRWLSDVSHTQFLERALCFIDQYENFTVEHEGNIYPVDGRGTVDENIADHGGLKLALKALQSLQGASGEQEELLPALSHLTPLQLFFINYGQQYCGQILDEEYIILKFLTDLHAPDSTRVNGPVMNMPEFATAFKCPGGAPMNPALKCSLW